MNPKDIKTQKRYDLTFQHTTEDREGVPTPITKIVSTKTNSVMAEAIGHVSHVKGRTRTVSRDGKTFSETANFFIINGIVFSGTIRMPSSKPKDTPKVRKAKKTTKPAKIAKPKTTAKPTTSAPVVSLKDLKAYILSRKNQYTTRKQLFEHAGNAPAAQTCIIQETVCQEILNDIQRAFSMDIITPTTQMPTTQTTPENPPSTQQ